MSRKRRELNGDLNRLRELDAIRVLQARLGRAVTAAEVALECGAQESEVRIGRLVRDELVLRRKLDVDGNSVDAFVPREMPSADFPGALLGFGQISNNVTVRWTDRRGNRQFTMQPALRSHVAKTLRSAADHLGVGEISDLGTEHIPFLINAAWVALMRQTPIPEAEWFSDDKRAKKARASVGKRCSELSSFISWADHKGYIWAARVSSTLMSRPWAEFVALVAKGTKEEKNARELVAKAWSVGANTPEDLVEIGFDTFEQAIMSDSRYANSASAKSAVSRCRSAWNARADKTPHLPMWESDYRAKRRTDGGLDLTWWSATAVVNERPSILDEPGMELQRKQAYALREWWAAFDPTLREDADGNALPPRPVKKGRYVKQLGSRDGNPRIAQIPLSAVSRLQRFVLSEDEERYRISPDDMKTMPWADLFRDRARMVRFAEHEYARNARRYGGKISRGAIWQRTSYCYTMMWAYFPAYLLVRQEKLRKRLNELSVDPANDIEARKLEAERRAVDDELQEWEKAAESFLKRLKQLDAKYGFVEVKPREEIARCLSHDLIVGRFAGHLREKRLLLEAALLEQTDALVRHTESARGDACDEHGSRACDLCHPVVAPTSRGVATSLLTREYCQLVTKETLLRLPAILPWRPGTFRRAIIGRHIDPDTLALAVMGNDDKIAYDTNGGIKRLTVTLRDLPSITFPQEVDFVVECLETLIADVQPWLWEHPSKAGLKTRKDAHRTALFLNDDGVPWASASTLALAFRGILEECARAINAEAKDGETLIELPTGYGAKASYTMRFLWGHRAFAAGVPVHLIAKVLGNSPQMVIKHYQRVDQTTAVAAAASVIAANQERKDHEDFVGVYLPELSSREVEPLPDEDGYLAELDMWVSRWEADAITDADLKEVRARLRKKHGLTANEASRGGMTNPSRRSSRRRARSGVQ